MTWANFLTYVKQDFKRTDKDTEILQAYNDTILDLSSRAPHSAYKYQSYVAVVAGQEDYPLPGNSIHIIHPLRYLKGTGTNDSGWPLTKITKAEYDIQFTNPNRTSPQTGTPTKYCIYSESVLLGPIPGTAEVTGGAIIEVNWTIIPTDQSADADTPSFGDEWREILKWGTLFRLYAGLGLDPEASKWKTLYEDDLAGYPKLERLDKAREGNEIGKVRNNSL